MNKYLLAFIIASLTFSIRSSAQSNVSVISSYTEVGGMNGARVGLLFESKRFFWGTGLKILIDNEFSKDRAWYKSNYLSYRFERAGIYYITGFNFWKISDNSKLSIVGDIQLQQSNAYREIYIPVASGVNNYSKLKLFEIGVPSLQSSIAVQFSSELAERLGLWVDFGYSRTSILSTSSTINFGIIVVDLDHSERFYNSTFFQIGLKYDLSKKK